MGGGGGRGGGGRREIKWGRIGEEEGDWEEQWGKGKERREVTERKGVGTIRGERRRVGRSVGKGGGHENPEKREGEWREDRENGKGVRRTVGRRGDERWGVGSRKREGEGSNRCSGEEGCGKKSSGVGE